MTGETDERLGRRSRMTKAEVRLVAEYCALVSSDKLVEALAFPTVSQSERDVLSAELDLRLSRLDRN
jgi:hypothetical protein